METISAASFKATCLALLDKVERTVNQFASPSAASPLLNWSRFPGLTSAGFSDA